MEKIISLLFLFTILFTNYSYTQNEPTKVELSLVDTMENGRHATSPLYEVGAKNRIHRGKKKIKVPNENTSYGVFYIYYNGYTKMHIPEKVAVLVENYTTDTPLFYFDSNNNLDFSDDGAYKTYETNSIVIKDRTYRFLRHQFLSDNSSLPFEFLIVEPYSKEGLDKLKATIKISKKEKVVDVKYWLGLYPFKTKRGELITKNGKVQVELIDVNRNQKFNDAKIDNLVIRYSNKEGVELEDRWKAIENKTIQIDDLSYHISEIDRNGESISFTQTTNQSENKKYHIGDNISQLEVKTLSKNNKSLEQILGKDKKTLLYFWGTWCGPCKVILPELKEIYSTYKENLEILAIAKDSASNVKKYISQNKIQWLNVLATESILSSLNITSYPTFILLGSNGVIDEKAKFYEIQDLIKQ